MTVEAPDRIIAAMRASVGSRGAAASTFDHVARQAHVSRGLLHYHFGSKERLLVEVVRKDCALRLRALQKRVHAAASVDEVIAVVLGSLEEVVHEDPDFVPLMFELFTVAQRSA